MRQEALQELWRAASEHPAESLSDLDAARDLCFVLRQTFRYRYSAPVSGLEQRLIVVPPSRHGAQRRRYHRVSVVGGAGRASWSRDAFANAVADVRVPAVADAIEFQVDAVLERTGDGPAMLPEAALRDPRYLDTDRPLTAPDEALVHAAHAAAGGSASAMEAAERLCRAVYESLPYRKGATTVSTTAAEAFAIGAGVCQDHAHVMLAMCRAIGLPARYVSGHMLGEGATHAWVEVIAPHGRRGAAAAVPFDPCYGRRPGASYVTVAVGRDYQDVPPTSGAYHGRSVNQLTSTTRVGVTLLDRSANNLGLA